MIEKNQDILTQKSILKEERGAFKTFYNANYKSFFLVCLRYAKSKDEAQDFLQDAFIAIHKDMHQFNPDKGGLKTWCRRVVINTCLQKLRKHSVLDNVVSDLSEITNYSISTSTPIENLSVQELLTLVRKLPKGCQTIFNLYVIDGYNHREIGEKLNISPNTSKTQLMKARKMLQGNIADQSQHQLANGIV